MKEKLFDAFDITYRGILWAVCLGWFAFVAKISFKAIPFAMTPLLASWAIGRMRGFEVAHRSLIAEMSALSQCTECGEQSDRRPHATCSGCTQRLLLEAQQMLEDGTMRAAAQEKEDAQ